MESTAILELLKQLGVAGATLAVLYLFARAMLTILSHLAAQATLTQKQIAEKAIESLSLMSQRHAETLTQEREQRAMEHKVTTQILDTQTSLLEEEMHMIGDIHRAVVPSRPARIFVPGVQRPPEPDPDKPA